MGNEITPEDELKAENELLKLKLEMEHGITDMASGKLPANVENQWLNHMYNFEKAYKDAGRIKLYDFIGKPAFRKVENLTNAEISGELARLLDVMAQNGVLLDFICKYSDAIKYEFLTGELFEYEMDDMRIPDMTTNFIYEEFHPNHDYDLRNDGIDLIEGILKHKWSEDFHAYKLGNPVLFHGKEYNRHDISGIILAFQEGHKQFKNRRIKIREVSFSLEEGWGKVSMQLSYKAELADGTCNAHSGEAVIHHKYDGDYWSISEFSLPGL